MRTTTALLALLSVTALLAPMTAAQSNPTEAAPITFSADAQTLSFDGDQTLSFSASIACTDLINTGTLEGMGAYEATVDITLPEGFTGDDSTTLEFDGTPCISEQASSVSAGNASVNITPGLGAAGMVDLEVDLTSGSSTGTIPFTVDYRPGYFFDVSQTFPVEVSKDENGEWIPIQWTATISLDINADTMVMMQVTDKATYGSLSGLFANSPHIFRDLTGDQVQNGITKTVTFTYTPTSDEWTEDTVSFITWSHYLNDGAMKTDDQEVTWTFVNGAAETDGGKGTPGIGVLPVTLALMGAALVASRRHE